VSGAETQVPVLQVTGSPTDEELAAVVVVLTAMLAAPVSLPHAAEPSRWAAAARQGRPPLTPGPGAWVGSARPH
jgi:hypothetical protein